MAKEITAYVSHDGQLHKTREDAEFSEFSIELKDDIADFLKQRQASAQDTPVLQRLLRDWELWKRGESAPCACTPTPRPAVSKPDDSQQLRLPLQPRPQAAPVAKTRPVKRKQVLVFGLPADDHAAIQQAFGDCFDLLLHDKSNPPQISVVKRCHKVFVMIKFVGFLEMNHMRSKGLTPISIPGDVADLDTKLTTLYVEGH